MESVLGGLNDFGPNTRGPSIVDDVQYVPRMNNYRDHSDKHMGVALCTAR